MNIKRTIVIAFLVVILLPVSVFAALCTPGMDFSYAESLVTTGPFSGKWQYDFTLSNNSTATGDCTDYDIFYVDLTYAGSRDFLDGALPVGWGDGFTQGIWFSTSGFSLATSMNPGIPPTGNDLPPGSSLTGFSFKTTVRYGEMSDPELWEASVLMNDPFDSTTPIYLSQTFPPPSVPEPGTVMLLGAGLAVMGIYGRVKKIVGVKK
ncbi:MAG: PEP-CTERM sorting domain-containing protein [Nitrospirae bacterium]|nr:PEP-CTERM sorting domain-containing protein [Nitrospirota bacterium]